MPWLHVDPVIGATVLASNGKAMQAHEVKPKAAKDSKAALVSSLFDEAKTVEEIAAALNCRGVRWPYAWDVAATYEKKTGKVFIASHGKDGAK